MSSENEFTNITIDLPSITLDASSLTPLVAQIYLNTAYCRAIMDKQVEILSLLQKKDIEIVKAEMNTTVQKHVTAIGKQIEKQFPAPASNQEGQS